MEKGPRYYKEPGIRFPIYYKNIYSGRLITQAEYEEMIEQCLFRGDEGLDEFVLADKMDILMNTNKEKKKDKR